MAQQLSCTKHQPQTLTFVLPCFPCQLACLSSPALVAGISLQGRKVAVFGCGDQHGYGDYFCDAMEELYSSFKAAGCDMVGTWPTEGYEHSESKVGAKKTIGGWG